MEKGPCTGVNQDLASCCCFFLVQSAMSTKDDSKKKVAEKMLEKSRRRKDVRLGRRGAGGRVAGRKHGEERKWEKGAAERAREQECS